MKGEFGILPDPVEFSETAEVCSQATEVLDGLPEMSDGRKLERKEAVQILNAIFQLCPDAAANVVIPGIPYDGSNFDGYTAGLLRKGIELFAKEEKISTETLRLECRSYLYAKYDNATNRVSRWNYSLERERRNRILLSPDKLNHCCPAKAG